MSSTSTTWTVDTNTKSGGAQTFSTTISSLKILGDEGDDAILRLFADEGDDNADQWRLVSSSSTNKLNFMSFASGSWSNVLSLYGHGTAASVYAALPAASKLYLDGIGNTYIQESSADVLDIYVGGANMIKLTESTTDTVTITGDLTVGVDDTGHDVKFFGATASHYLLWDESGDDLVLAGSTSTLSIDSTVDSSSTTTGSFHTDGGVGIAKKLYVGTILNNATAANLATSSGVTTIGSSNALTISAAGVLTVNSATDASSSTSGSTIIDGGVGIAKKLYVGTDLDVDGTANLDVVDIDGAVDMASTLTLAGNADFNGDLDVDGTTNLDAVDIDGNVQLDATFTVGVDDTGYDVKFFGATATNGYMLWDESTDDLILGSSSKLGIGTATPQKELHVNGSIRTGVLNIYNADTTLAGYVGDGANMGAGYTSDDLVMRAVTDMGFLTNDGSTNAMTIKSSGNVGIGTATPGAILDIAETKAGAAVVLRLTNKDETTSTDETCNLEAHFHGTDDRTGGKIVFGKDGTYADGGTSDSNLSFWTAKDNTNVIAMHIDSDQNVGIGTTSPGSLLHIESGSVGGAVLSLSQNASSPAVADTNIIGEIDFAGWDSSGGDSYRIGGKILAKAQGAWGSSSNNPVKLEFYTEDGNTGSSGLGSPRMVIDKDGSVGIGTASPDSSLEISKDTDGRFTALKLTNESDAANTTGYVSIGFDLENTSGTAVPAGYINCVKEQSFTSTAGTNDSYISFETADNGTLSEKVWIKSDGKVGIGTATPASELDVRGEIRAYDDSVGLGIYSASGTRYAKLNQNTITFENAEGQIGTASTTDLRFQTNATRAMTILGSNQNVGIGTATPATRLHVEETAAGGSNSGGHFRLSCNDGSSMGSGQQLGRIEFAGAEDGSSNMFVGARIYSLADGGWDADTHGSGLSFATSPEDNSDTVPQIRMQITSVGNVGIGTQTPNANLEIDQLTDDDAILTLSSTGDVAHGVTNVAETDVFAQFKKYTGASGGLEIDAITEATRAVYLHAVATTEDTDAVDASSDAAFVINTVLKTGVSTTAHGSGGIIFLVENNGGAKFAIDAEGDFFADSGTAATQFDAYDDAHLVRALSLSKGHKSGLIDSKFDEFVKYNHEKLAELGLVGRHKEDGTPNHYINVTGMQRLHNGAIWQQYTEMQKMKELMYETMVELMGKDKADKKLDSHDIKLLDKDLLN